MLKAVNDDENERYSQPLPLCGDPKGDNAGPKIIPGKNYKFKETPLYGSFKPVLEMSSF